MLEHQFQGHLAEMQAEIDHRLDVLATTNPGTEVEELRQQVNLALEALQSAHEQPEAAELDAATRAAEMHLMDAATRLEEAHLRLEALWTQTGNPRAESDTPGKPGTALIRSGPESTDAPQTRYQPRPTAFKTADPELFGSEAEAILLQGADRVSAQGAELQGVAELVVGLADRIGQQADALAEGFSEDGFPTPRQKLGDFQCNPQPLVTFIGGNGNDLIVGSPVSNSISGGTGNDILIGGPQGDRILGGQGNDWIFGLGGRDEGRGEDGNDVVLGNSGNDCLFGGKGRDLLVGNGGDDGLRGGDDEDALFGSGGEDLLEGGEGRDLLMGMAHNDRLVGGNGIDLMFGGDHDDTLLGGSGEVVNNLSNVPIHLGNVMFGNPGKDRIVGGAGIDVAFGNRDEDTLIGGDQVDVLFGNTGEDILEGGDGGVLFTIKGIPIRLGNLLFGNQHNDRLTGGPDLDIAFGNQGNDIIHGGDGSFLILGLDHDLLFGGEGNDTVDGGRGSDWVFGNDGNDIVRGNAIHPQFLDLTVDKLFGNRGDDTLEGNDARDLIFGNQGHDDIYGGDGWDLIFGNRGCDRIDGGDGWDLIFGNHGNDEIQGGDGWDTLFGNQDHDTLRGGDGWDTLFGNSGNDVLEGQDGWDRLVGNSDADILVGGDGWDVFFGNDGDDSIDGGRGVDLVLANSGDDCVLGGNSFDFLFGNSGADCLDGQNGWDRLDGNEGDDTLIGGSGNDRIRGGRGNDRIDGGPGFDVLRGNSGNDSIWGGPGFDLIFGGSGNDNTQQGGSGNLSCDCNRPKPRCIKGTKFHDLDGDGERDPDEPPLAGWTFNAQAQGPPGLAASGQGVSDAEGHYEICGLPSGCYTVTETMQDGWQATTANPRSVLLSAVVDATGVDFGNRMPPLFGCLRGMKFADRDGDGVRDEGETGLAGWVIVASSPAGSTETVTGEGGVFEICGLPAGVYLLTEIQQPGWTQTAPPEGFQEVFLEEGSSMGGILFGNRADLTLTSEVEVREGCDRLSSITVTVRLTVIGGTAPYQCAGPGTLVSEPDVTCTFVGVPKGDQTFTVTDAAGFSVSEMLPIRTSVNIVDIAVEDPGPEGACQNGRIEITIESEAEVTSIRWFQLLPEQRELDFTNSTVAEGLGSGTYSVVVFNAEGCSERVEVELMACGCGGPANPCPFTSGSSPGFPSR